MSCQKLRNVWKPRLSIHGSDMFYILFHSQENSLDGYHVGEHIEFMKSLETKFREIVLQDMKTLNKV